VIGTTVAACFLLFVFTARTTRASSSPVGDPLLTHKISFDQWPGSGRVYVVFNLRNENPNALICIYKPVIDAPRGFSSESIILKESGTSTYPYRPCVYPNSDLDWQVTIREKSDLERWLRLFAIGANDDVLRYSFQYEIFATAEGGIVGKGFLDGKVSLSPVRPGSAIAGLIAGSVLLQLILITTQRVDRRKFGRGLLQGVLGGVAILIIGKITTGLELPIEFEVKDFLGGAVLGLLSQRFLKSLLEFIQDQTGSKSADNSSSVGATPIKEGGVITAEKREGEVSA
jgi:hypothetical protein